MKPTPELINDWHEKARQMAIQADGYFDDVEHWRHFAELAAAWGAKQAQQTTDAARVLEWMRTPNRKQANLAFTEGPERQAAYWVEIGQQEMQAHYAAGVRAGMAQSQWQPIETAPKDEIVMVAVEFDCAGDWRIKVGYEDSENGCWKVWGASWTPTHWMPLPTPPKEQQ